MCGGRAIERQESDGEKAVGKEGGVSTVSTLNVKEREEKRWACT